MQFGALREDFYRGIRLNKYSTKAGYTMRGMAPYGDWGSRKYLIASLDQSLKRMGLGMSISLSPIVVETRLKTMKALRSPCARGKRVVRGDLHAIPADLARQAICDNGGSQYALPDSSA